MTVMSESIYTYCDCWDCMIAAKEREIAFPHTSLREEIFVNTQHLLVEAAGLAAATTVNLSKNVLNRIPFPHF